MNLIFDLILFCLNCIVAVFTVQWIFVVVFLIMGICAVKEDYKGAGAFCIILALLVATRWSTQLSHRELVSFLNYCQQDVKVLLAIVWIINNKKYYRNILFILSFWYNLKKSTKYCIINVMSKNRIKDRRIL